MIGAKFVGPFSVTECRLALCLLLHGITALGITPEYRTHPTVIAIGLGLRLGLGLELGLGIRVRIKVRDYSYELGSGIRVRNKV